MCSMRNALAGSALLLAGIIITWCSRANADRQLYFSLMVSGAAGLNTSAVVPAVDQELHDINSDPTILAGYILHYTGVLETKVCITQLHEVVYTV